VTLAAETNRVLRSIALFKFFKTILFAAAGLAALQLLRPGVADAVNDWLLALPFGIESRFAQRTADQIAALTPGRIKTAGFAGFAYALLFLVEGVGLWQGRTWAEYLTVFASATLIPFEVRETLRGPTAIKIAILLLNLTIVSYLFNYVRKRRLAAREA
jgi:uncharacterized membrane protein (DUF2068 family)